MASHRIGTTNNRSSRLGKDTKVAKNNKLKWTNRKWTLAHSSFSSSSDRVHILKDPDPIRTLNFLILRSRSDPNLRICNHTLCILTNILTNVNYEFQIISKIRSGPDPDPDPNRSDSVPASLKDVDPDRIHLCN